MTPMTRGNDAWREMTARRLADALRLRAELNEGVGIRQVWQVCGPSQARADLRAEYGDAGQGAEARRMIAAVDAAADHRSDPDVGWN